MSNNNVVNSSLLSSLAEQGVSVWLDDLSREAIKNGSIETLMREYQVMGITTNPSIFAASISQDGSYLEQLYKDKNLAVKDIILNLTVQDVQDACKIFFPMHQETLGINGRVSIEVDPSLANNTEETIIAAQDLYKKVACENVMIKIPATLAGLEAITEVVACGISVNVTLIFSLNRYRAVINAFMSGLEKAQRKGIDISKIHSVASFFISRMDIEIDRQLNAVGTPEALNMRGKAALANGRLAYEIYEQQFASSRWETLEFLGANRQRILWASTGVKNLEYSNTMYVAGLIADNTVNTMPRNTLQAVRDSIYTGDTNITDTYLESKAVLDKLSKLQINYQNIVDLLEVEGVEKFITSWEDLKHNISKKLTSIGSNNNNG